MDVTPLTKDLEYTVEDLGRGGYRLLQGNSGFRFGEDTVLLAHFAAQFSKRLNKPLRAFELGANCGAASILLAARRADISIDSVEIQKDAFHFLEQNVAINKLEERIRAYCLDARLLLNHNHTDLIKSSYDLVFMNPPYQSADLGLTMPEEEALRYARFECNGDLGALLKVGAKMLRPMGNLVLVHRAQRLPEVLTMMAEYKLGAVYLQMVHPRVDRAANLFLLMGQKGRKPGGFQILPPLCLYDEMGEPSAALQAIYREEE